MKNIQLIPAILAVDFPTFKKQWLKVAKLTSTIQIDIMDGVLVSTKNNIKPQQIKQLTKTHSLEIHLMVKDLASYLSEWSRLTNVKKIIWHYNAETDLEAILCLIDFLKRKKIKVGLCLDLNNTPQAIKKIIPHLDTVQIMGIVAGKQGQKFQTKALNKIKTLRSNYPHINIELDGGVNTDNFQKIIQAGANILVLGSSLQQAPNPKTAYYYFKKNLRS